MNRLSKRNGRPALVERFSKHTQAGRAFVVEIFDDGSLIEYDPELPAERWTGTWTESFDSEMVRNCLEMVVGDYTTRYFQDRMMPYDFWSGVEQLHGERIGISRLELPD